MSNCSCGCACLLATADPHGIVYTCRALLMQQCVMQNGQECLFAELDTSTFMDNHAGTAGGAVGSTSASLPVVLRCDGAFPVGLSPSSRKKWPGAHRFLYLRCLRSSLRCRHALRLAETRMHALELTKLARSSQLRRARQQDPGKLEHVAYAPRRHTADIPSQCAHILQVSDCCSDAEP